MKVRLPQVGESVTEAYIGPWLKSVGDRIEKYEPVVEIVTDKVTMEMPSPATGVLSAIVVAEGQTVPMGAVIAEIEVEGEEPEEREDAPAVVPGAASEASLTGTLLKDVAPVGPTGSGGPACRPAAARARGTRRPCGGSRPSTAWTCRPCAGRASADASPAGTSRPMSHSRRHGRPRGRLRAPTRSACP